MTRLRYEDGFFFNPRTGLAETENHVPEATVVVKKDRLARITQRDVCTRPNGQYNQITSQLLDSIVGGIFQRGWIKGTSVYAELDRLCGHAATLRRTEQGRELHRALCRVRESLLEVHEACKPIRGLDFEI